jgi:PERQ amino acid-rich with GYF domain-containing protein
MNGTLTFRRTSATPSSQAFSQPNMLESAGPSDDPAVLSAMPVGSTAVDNAAPRRYSREELLSISENMGRDPATQLSDVSALFVSGWNPGHANGVSSRGWGKPADSNALPQEPDICWDAQGSTKAVGLQEMTSEEKEVG